MRNLGMNNAFFLLIFAHSLKLENYKSSRVEQCLQSTNYKHMPELAKWLQCNVSDELYSEILQNKARLVSHFCHFRYIYIYIVFLFASVFCCGIYCFKVKRKLCPCISGTENPFVKQKVTFTVFLTYDKMIDSGYRVMLLWHVYHVILSTLST